MNHSDFRAELSINLVIKLRSSYMNNWDVVRDLPFQKKLYISSEMGSEESLYLKLMSSAIAIIFVAE